jgi:hypothetical protein
MHGRHEKERVQTPASYVWRCCFKDLNAFPADFYGPRIHQCRSPSWIKTAYLSRVFVERTPQQAADLGESCQFGQIQGLQSLSEEVDGTHLVHLDVVRAFQKCLK